MLRLICLHLNHCPFTLKLQSSLNWAFVKRLVFGKRTLVESFLRAFHFSTVWSKHISALRLGGKPTGRMERESLASEDLKRIGALVPLGQKRAVWIRTGNLSLLKRTALTRTIEPRLHISDNIM
jgi:hypothetical protein